MYRSGGFGNALHELLNYSEAIKNRHKCTFSVMLENSSILFMYCFVFVNSRPANCDSLMELGQSSTSTNYSRFPEASSKRRNSCALKYFGVLHLVLSRSKLSCEQFSSFFFFDNFYNAFFQRKRVHNDGLDFFCQNSFRRCGEVNSVLCFWLKSSMNLMIHLPRFPCICNYFGFAGIVVETDCTPSL